MGANASVPEEMEAGRETAQGHLTAHPPVPQQMESSTTDPPFPVVQVMVQLPMFNETFVARRIIDFACKLEYPRESFEVQVGWSCTQPEGSACVSSAGVHELVAYLLHGSFSPCTHHDS